MKIYLCFFLLIFAQQIKADNFAVREEAYRANNLGTALLEQYKAEEAAAEFRRALQLRPDFRSAKINLAIALYNAQKLAEARQILAGVLIEIPNSPQANYILGLIGRTENTQEESLTAFRKVLVIDENDVGANVNVGQILTQKRFYDEAVKYFQLAYEVEPYNTTAIYNLATTLQRTGKRERAAELLKKFQALRESGAGTSIGLNYLEQGRYAEAIISTGAESELVDRSEPKVSFRETNIGLPLVRPKRSPALAGAVLFDADNDGDLDLALTDPAKIFRNERGKFIDISARSGDFAKPAKDSGVRAVAGDFDNDNLADLFVVRGKSYSLYKNLGKGKFADVTAKAKLPVPTGALPARSCAFVDIDHDGDLDIFVGGAGGQAGNKLFRNNGDATFTDYSAQAKINRQMIAVSIVPTDFDNRRDVDLLVLAAGENPSLFRNLRDTTFRDVAAETNLNQKAEWNCAAAGDFNKDSFVDFFFGKKGGRGVFAVSDGRGKFEMKDAPIGTEDATSAQFLDYDNDGLLDLIANTPKGLVVSRNLGENWSEASGKIFKTTADVSNSNQIISADLDSDGDVDLLTFDKKGALRFLRNDGGNANRAEILQIQGRVSNKTGIGAKINLRSGSLAQKLETYSASPSPAPSQVVFGLGKRENPDTVSVIWTSGIIQSEIEFGETNAKNNTPFKIEELDRKPSSCPYLYTWNGEKFEFITDFLGGGEMGNWAAAGEYHYPDSDEFVRIPADKLKAKNGRYEIRVTNELEEVLFLDNLKLVALEHPEKTEVYPNEGLGIPTFGQRILYTTENSKPPLSATDKDGKSVLAKITKLDRDFYDSFKSLPIRGYTETHELTLNLDGRKGFNGRTILLLTGWTDYAFSSDNFAAAQSGKSLFMPYLQVRNDRGEWQTVVESIGIPVGRPQTVVVDLTAKFLTGSREVRIVTNFKTFWDKIEVDTSAQTSDLKTIELQPVQATLSERGFSAEVVTNGMISADYENVFNDGRWKFFAGKFTRLGDVKSLLEAIDDTFVISKTGDELVLSFAALPELPAGRKYTFLLYADGYSKEMDINSGSPEAVFPLPFKGMTKYPYGADEKYPLTEEKQRIYDETLTRFSRGGIANF